MKNLSSPGKGKAWLEAARPRTLPASLSPVLVGAALASRDGYFQWIPTLLCVLVALLAQIASNFANDYFDFKKGADGADRLGPERAVAQGWIQPKSMLTGTFITLGLACFCGCMLLFFAGWELIPVGIAIALCVLAYSAGPFPLAYNGLGDVCVLLLYLLCTSTKFLVTVITSFCCRRFIISQYSGHQQLPGLYTGQGCKQTNDYCYFRASFRANSVSAERNHCPVADSTFLATSLFLDIGRLRTFLCLVHSDLAGNETQKRKRAEPDVSPYSSQCLALLHPAVCLSDFILKITRM